MHLSKSCLRIGGGKKRGGGGRGAYENLTYGGESENSPSNKCMHE